MVSEQTEKTHAGTLVEIALARALRLADGTTLDYTIAGAEVDCKFSHRLGGWMIPPEADGKLLLLVQASDEDGTWAAGLLRATAENLRPAGNRDGKRALNDRGRTAVRWLHARAPLQENPSRGRRLAARLGRRSAVTRARAAPLTADLLAVTARPKRQPPPASAGQATPDSAETLASPTANRNRMACSLPQGQMSKDIPGA